MFKKYEHIGILTHNQQGRYCLQDNYYFTSGDPIEIYYDDMWLIGRMEYSQKYQDYYFLNEDEGIYIYSISDLNARI